MQRRVAQAQTEYVVLLLVSLALVAGVTRYSDHVSRAYGGGAAALPGSGEGQPAAGGPSELTFRVPGPVRVRTAAGEGTLTFLRRTPTGWAPLRPGDTITSDMEFAIEVTYDDDPGVPSSAASIGWAGRRPPPEGLSSVVIVEIESSAGSAGGSLAASVPIERTGDGRYRSGPLRLPDVLGSMR